MPRRISSRHASIHSIYLVFRLVNALRLPGNTLVQYAGSLTGQDFRIIAQVAPFVLYDLVTAESFAAWVSLSNLVPLIWQPEIQDIDAYTVNFTLALINSV